MLTIVGGFAEFERDIIRQRTAAGIERAKRIGRPFGRKPKLTARQKAMIAERFTQGETLRDIGRAFGVCAATAWKAIHGL
jgi:DNA invertase Pin-like site-specific DNA recombinase